MDRNNPSDSSSKSSESRVALDVLPLHSTHLLTVLDENGIIQYESPSIERIYGFDQDELVGDQVAEYFHPDDRAAVIDAFRAVVNNDEAAVEAVEYRHQQADGTYTWVESVASANPTPNGNYVVNTRDISDQKAREQQLQDTNERLNEFASIVSHDLRNPLHVADSTLALAAETGDRDRIADARAHLERMERMIDDLLMLARSGRTVEDPERISLSEAAREAWNHADVTDCELDLSVPKGTALEADRDRLMHVFENLFRNAAVHNDAPVTVRVGLLGEDDSPSDGGQRTGFVIEDTGGGIPETDRSKIFEYGYTTNTAGTGVGLAIVRDIVEAHDWDIRVTDGTAGGACFEVTGVSMDH